MIQLIDSTIQDTRLLVSEIGSPVLYELGFEAAVEWLVKQTREKYDLNVDFRNDNQPKPLSEDVKVFLFQAVRELLVNAAKHSKASNCTVSLKTKGKKVKVVVVDDGVGFDAESMDSVGAEGNHFGFFSIRERLEPLGGSQVVGIGIPLTVAAHRRCGRPIDAQQQNKGDYYITNCFTVFHDVMAPSVRVGQG